MTAQSAKALFRATRRKPYGDPQRFRLIGSACWRTLERGDF
jgi:hypothetical protein